MSLHNWYNIWQLLSIRGQKSIHSPLTWGQNAFSLGTCEAMQGDSIRSCRSGRSALSYLSHEQETCRYYIETHSSKVFCDIFYYGYYFSPPAPLSALASSWSGRFSKEDSWLSKFLSLFFVQSSYYQPSPPP